MFEQRIKSSIFLSVRRDFLIQAYVHWPVYCIHDKIHEWCLFVVTRTNFCSTILFCDCVCVLSLDLMFSWLVYHNHYKKTCSVLVITSFVCSARSCVTVHVCGNVCAMLAWVCHSCKWVGVYVWVYVDLKHFATSKSI